MSETKGCGHKKERFCLWCDPCAEKIAGDKPKLEYTHGDIVLDRDGDPHKVLDAEIHLIGQATETPRWSEYLVFGGSHSGSASMYTRLQASPISVAKIRFNVEVAVLYTDKTWDSTWGEVEAENEEDAKTRAESDTLLDLAHHSENPERIAHVTAVCIQKL